jgi:hypothetical protein
VGSSPTSCAFLVRWFFSYMFWFNFIEKKLILRAYDPAKALGRKSLGSNKVKFVREQRIFAKGSKGPVKKRSTTVLRELRLYMSSGLVQNTPPLSTLLNLFGINVIKFCEDYNNRIKNLFVVSHLPIVLNIVILKDLNYIFKLEGLRFNYFLVALEMSRILKKGLVITYSKSSMLTIVPEDNNENVENRIFSSFDLWFFFLIIERLKDIFQIYSLVNFETFILTNKSFLLSLQDYKYKDINLI